MKIELIKELCDRKFQGRVEGGKPGGPALCLAVRPGESLHYGNLPLLLLRWQGLIVVAELAHIRFIFQKDLLEIGTGGPSVFRPRISAGPHPMRQVGVIVAQNLSCLVVRDNAANQPIDISGVALYRGADPERAENGSSARKASTPGTTLAFTMLTILRQVAA